MTIVGHIIDKNLHKIVYFDSKIKISISAFISQYPEIPKPS